MTRHPSRNSRWFTVLASAALNAACSARAAHVERGATAGTREVVGQSWDICTLVGPQRERPGIYGTDLGISVPLPASYGQPGQLAMLFGDSWAAQGDACAYPIMNADDLQAMVPAARPADLTSGPPTAAGATACDSLHYPLSNESDPTTWPRIRLFKDAQSRTDENQLNTGMLRTPVAAWTDGQHVFGAFVRDEAARCSTVADCPSGMLCTADPGYGGKRIGACSLDVSLTPDGDPRYCLSDSDCPQLSSCGDLDSGLCVAAEPFRVQRDGQVLQPDWYDEDPRRGLALRIYLGTALWPDRPQDYGTGVRFVTNKFINPAARTVTHFDPVHPENNDYSPGTETLLMWGRPAFIATKGFQALPFLLYQPLSGLLDEQGNIHWAPKFFAGYGQDGRPVWSDSEADAQPLYGVDENLVKQANGQWQFQWQQPEVDYLEQMTVAWLTPLQRWVMVYGGHPPAFALVDPGSGEPLPPAHPESIAGSIYLRAAAHPWGRLAQDAPQADAYGPARPILTRSMMAKHLACDDDATDTGGCSPQRNTHDPGDLLSALANFAGELGAGDLVNVSASCIAGDAALGVQNSLFDDSSGHLYGANIIEQWTQDVTDQTPGLAADERVAEMYWNVSTWNPYQVVLVKTQLRRGGPSIE